MLLIHSYIVEAQNE